MALAATLTTPAVMPSASDEAFADAVRESRLFMACRSTSPIFDAAWRDARVNRWSLGLRAGWAASSGAARVRLVAASIASAGVTALALRAAGPAWVAPFTWVLPLACALSGSMASIAAAPLARAIAARFS